MKEQEVNNLKTEITRLNKELSDLKIQNDNLSLQNKLMIIVQEENNNLRQKNKENTERTSNIINDLKQQNTQLQQKVDILKDQNAQLQQEVDILHESCDYVLRDREMFLNEVNTALFNNQTQMNYVHSHYRNILRIKDDKIKSLKENVSQLIKELETKKQQYLELNLKHYGNKNEEGIYSCEFKRKRKHH